MEWPDFFPKACPPADSLDAEGNLYRIIKGTEPKKKDFLCHWIKYPQHQKKWQRLGLTCESCGLSVFTSLDDAKEVMDTVRHLGDKIIMADLDGDTGKLKHTPRDLHERHYTWWVPISVEKPWTFFKVVA